MSVTHTWQIVKLIQLNDDTGTIVKVRYKVTSVEDDIEAVDESNVQLNVKNIENFIPYSQLDEETVLSWVKEKLLERSIDPESKNIDEINSIKNPPKPKEIQSKLPWVE